VLETTAKLIVNAGILLLWQAAISALHLPAWLPHNVFCFFVYRLGIPHLLWFFFNVESELGEGMLSCIGALGDVGAISLLLHGIFCTPK
jgi:hypothetical protein